MGNLIDPQHLINASDIAAMFSVHRATVTEWARRKGFPQPKVVIGAERVRSRSIVRLYDVNEVNEWAAKNVTTKPVRDIKTRVAALEAQLTELTAEITLLWKYV